MIQHNKFLFPRIAKREKVQKIKNKEYNIRVNQTGSGSGRV